DQSPPLLRTIRPIGIDYNFCMQQIVSGVYAHSNLSIYQYFIVADNEITLIDAGLPLFTGALLRALGNLDGSARLSLILITHADGDHYGAVDRLKVIHGCKVATSTLEAQAMQLGGMSRDLKPRHFLERLLFTAGLLIFTAQAVTTEHIISPGETLPILGGLKVLDSKGHTPGHLSFYQPDQRLLFAGDSIIKRNGIPSPAAGPNCWDEKLAQAAFDSQMALGPLHICGGHSYFNLSR
ncbi:MAG TPA: MBL fold metallo-hydrolase, partial [Bellilinea sp.]|nr:MBL fold metallo-hydrolase [Bellilinea sp.]